MDEVKKKKIYLSGAISGHSIEERRKVFEDVEHALSAVGWEVVNPMKNGLPVDSSTHEHMRRDFELLLQCDAIYMMSRWTHSAGCKVEFDVATAIGLDVYFEDAESVGLKGFVKFK